MEATRDHIINEVGVKPEDSKKADSKKDGSKEDGSKKADSKEDGSKKDGSKKDGSKKEDDADRGENWAPLDLRDDQPRLAGTFV